MAQAPTLFSLDSDGNSLRRKKLIRLIELCECSGIDLDRLYNEAWLYYRGEPDLVAFDIHCQAAIDESLRSQLYRLIELCEGTEIDLDLLYSEAWSRYRGEPDCEESG